MLRNMSAALQIPQPHYIVITEGKTESTVGGNAEITYNLRVIVVPKFWTCSFRRGLRVRDVSQEHQRRAPRPAGRLQNSVIHHHDRVDGRDPLALREHRR